MANNKGVQRAMIYPTCPKCKGKDVWAMELVKETKGGSIDRLWCKACGHKFEAEVKYGNVSLPAASEPAGAVIIGNEQVVPIFEPCPECGERNNVRVVRFLSDADPETRVYRAIIMCNRRTDTEGPIATTCGTEYEGNVKAPVKNARDVIAFNARNAGKVTGETPQARAEAKQAKVSAEGKAYRAKVAAEKHKPTNLIISHPNKIKAYHFMKGSVRGQCCAKLNGKMTVADYIKATKKLGNEATVLACLDKLAASGLVSIEVK